MLLTRVKSIFSIDWEIRNPPLKAALRGGAGSGWLQASVQATVLAPVLETVPWRELR
jgi:hypothetical protein